MGLGIYLTGRLRSGGLLHRQPDSKSSFLAIQDAVPTFLNDQLARRLMSGQSCGDTLQLELHPAEESVDFVVSGSELMVDAKTSSAGPGYHAMLVDFLEHLEAGIGVEWQWQDDEEEPADETGYHGHRDFERLQLAMSGQLKATADALLQHDDLFNVGLSVPFGFTVLGDAYAISPMGSWQKDWFERLVVLSPQDTFDMAAEFYPWWSSDRGARFWFNCASVLCWIGLPWHRPADDKERAAYELALDCFARAGELDANAPLPEMEIAEIRQMLSDDDLTRAPNTSGIGFRREMMRMPLTSCWDVRLPGYFYTGTEDDGQTTLYWFGERTVRGTSVKLVSKQRPDRPDGGEQFARTYAARHGADGKTFEIQNEYSVGSAYEAPGGAEGEPYWTLNGAIGSSDHACIVTIAYDDPESDREWALDIIRSISRSQTAD